MAHINTNEDWLDFLTNLSNTNTKTTSKITIKKVSNDRPLLSISVDRLFELYGNLQMAGFTQDEALIIIVGIANNARND